MRRRSPACSPFCSPRTRRPARSNTLLLQRVLAKPAWADRLGLEDQRGLTPLFWSNINPYGRFSLDMDTRLDLAAAPTAVP